MMNLQPGIVKMSHLERQINKLVLMLIGVLCVLSTILAIATSSWFAQSTWDDHFNNPDLYEQTDTTMSVVSFFTYFLLLHTFLPISLQVTIEVVKVVQALFISQDGFMIAFDKEFATSQDQAEEDARKFVICKSASLVEEIGQINYIFSDKTGTLTRNIMDFKYMLVGDQFYGDQVQFYAGLEASTQMPDIDESTPVLDFSGKGGGSKWQDDGYDDVMVNGKADPAPVYDGDLGIKK